MSSACLYSLDILNGLTFQEKAMGGVMKSAEGSGPWWIPNT